MPRVEELFETRIPKLISPLSEISGKVEIVEREDSWKITYLNNRSNGYYPAGNSFIWVKKALEFSGVVLEQDKFSETFPREGYADPEFLDLFAIKD